MKKVFVIKRIGKSFLVIAIGWGLAFLVYSLIPPEYSLSSYACYFGVGLLWTVAEADQLWKFLNKNDIRWNFRYNDVNLALQLSIFGLAVFVLPLLAVDTMSSRFGITYMIVRGQVEFLGQIIPYKYIFATGFVIELLALYISRRK